MKKEIHLMSGTLALDIQHSDFPFEDLCGFATRANNKRGFLFVSKVLGKHYPVKPHLMNNIYENLAHKLQQYTISLDTISFIGFAETAIGLGAGVYDAWKKFPDNFPKQSCFIPTTRFKFNQEILFEFKEEHSHATDQLIFKPNNDYCHNILTKGETLVLIDDEISTGKTLFNFIEQFITFNSRIKNVFLVSIKNWISQENKNMILQSFPTLNIQFISILEGTFEFTKNQTFIVDNVPKLNGKDEAKDFLFSSQFHNMRFGIENFNTLHDISFCNDFIQTLDLTKKTLIIGTNEYLVKPFFLAKHLEDLGCDVYFQSTTRSPIFKAHDILEKHTFLDNYHDQMENYIYNVSLEQYEQIVICYETKETFGFTLDKQLHAINYFMEGI